MTFNTLKALILFSIVFLIQASTMNGQVEISSNNNSNEKLTALKQVMSDFLDVKLTDSKFIAYMESSQTNIDQLKDVKANMSAHPQFDVWYLDQIIAGMERKLNSKPVEGEKGG